MNNDSFIQFNTYTTTDPLFGGGIDRHATDGAQKAGGEPAVDAAFVIAMIALGKDPHRLGVPTTVRVP